jgi:mRNA-degrading endonuclease RelE of RelBE toxin-antitoxin system
MTYRLFETSVFLEDLETIDPSVREKLKEKLRDFVYPQLRNQPYFGPNIISNLGIEYPEIYKVRKFACKALKGKGAMSGIRVIYAYFPDLDKVEFVEMYFKADQENEDRARVTMPRLPPALKLRWTRLRAGRLLDNPQKTFRRLK